MKRFDARTYMLGAGAVLLALAAMPAPAQVTGVATDPATSNLAAGSADTVTLRWQVDTDQGLGTTVTSGQGEFRADGTGGPVLGRITRSVSGTTDVMVGQNWRATITETVRIPQQVTLRAQSAGADHIVYVRTFDDGTGNTDNGDSTFALTGGLGGEFDIRRVALRFDDGSVQRVVAPRSELHANAHVAFSGSGRLEAHWEIARPASTRSEPVFRSIGLVRRELTGSGHEATLRSPELPTRNDGIYLLRLRITSPDSGLEAAEIGYAVNAGLEAAPQEGAVRGLGPAPGATWNQGTRFRWEALAGAVAYRLEFHDEAEADGKPVSGLLVSASVSETGISRVARSHLDDGRRYWWRLVAFDARGNVIGRSPPRSLRIPEPGG